ncbi:hypothetical protein Ctha_0785 [Chloroherpeton thalassium ATCC 35110]|uniref:DUF5689 domain-containing protein n=1 Tax=Chloroherpeton thalassium (strain ATCC 35110 / GB-78) TaxID=517418 RepID=B3QWE0_CHLT3|nr:hypothetical protein [Chloroherpeton thalassium]ACF13253.1 hypothetical protein Ctha_0785 [Chloroherpeton thalassium ATCC 35110]
MKPFNYFSLLFFSFLILTSCNIEDPAEPTWNIEGKLPLVQSTYSALSLVNQNDSVAIADANGIIAYVYEDVFETIEIGDSLAFGDTASTLSFEVGKRISLPSFRDTSYQQLSDLADATGFTLDESQTDIERVENLQSRDYTLSVADAIKSVQIDTGDVIATIINNTGIAFEDLTVEIWNGESEQAMTSLGQVVFENIASGNTVSESLTLNGKTIYPVFLAKIVDGSIPAQAAASFHLSDSLNMVIARGDPFSFITADAKIPAQTPADTNAISVAGNDVISVRASLLKKGQIDITVKNNLPEEIRAHIQSASILFPDVLTEQNQPFEIPVENPQSAILSETADLSGTTIKASALQSRDVLTHAKYIFRLEVDAIDDFVTINSSDEVSANVTVSDLVAKSFEGTTKSISYEIETEPLRIDAFENLGENPQAKFYNPRVVAEFQNSVDFDISGSPTFIGKANSQAVALTALPVEIEKASSTGSGTVVFDSSNSNVSAFLEIFPTEIIASGAMTFNPNQEEGKAEDTSKVRMKLKVVVPMAFDATRIVFKDTTSVSANNTEDIDALSVSIICESEFPLSASFYMIFQDESRTTMQREDGSVFRLPRNDSIVINTAPLVISSINADFWESNGSKTSTNVVELDAEEIRLLEQAKYAATFVTADTKDGEDTRKVILKTTDKLQIKVVGNATYRVNQE